MGVYADQKEGGRKYDPSKEEQTSRKARTRRLTLVSSMSTWSKQLMGARKMIAFISSKNGTQAAVQTFRSLNKLPRECINQWTYLAIYANEDRR